MQTKNFQILFLLLAMVIMNTWSPANAATTTAPTATTITPDYDALANLAVNGDRQALTQLQAAANSGNSKAQNDLGLYYASNNQYVEAFKWFQKAADRGFADAENNLGLAYDNGQGTSQDYTQAFN